MSEIIKEDYKHWGAIGALEKASAGYTCRAGNISSCHTSPSPYMHDRFHYSNSPTVLPVK